MADNRFSALATDPRYRLPSRKEARTAVDPRFKRLFTDQDFGKKASVDRYGRKIQREAGKKDLEKLYRLDKESEVSELAQQKIGSDSDEEDSAEDEDSLIAADPARGGGFSGSSSEEETSDEEENDDEAVLAEATAGQEQTEDIPLGEVTCRIAVVNLDWDHIRAADIMAVANSFIPQNGEIRSVVIYPSEFGRERMEREEIEGPPREIFSSTTRGVQNSAGNDESDVADESDEDSEDDDRIKKKLLQEQTEEGAEFDTTKLRQYQLERLRYYYAVISCDNTTTSKSLYDAMDGREYLSTSNFFDLRFVPDDTSFEDDKPHEECTQLPSGYKPSDFRTEALTHSKVKLTWDEDDAARKEVQKRAFSRAEMDEQDLQAYIGSDSSDAESVASRKSAAEDRRAKKRNAERESMRAALGLSDGTTKTSKQNKNDVVGDMQITFTSGLGGSKNGKSVFENRPQDESTRDKYIRKERERKQQRKDKLKTSHDGDAIAEPSDEMIVAEDGEHDPFDDPFFNDPAAAATAEKAAKKAAKLAKRATTHADDVDAKARRAELELLMAEDEADNVRHFDMRDIEKAEKLARKKGKKGKKHRDDEIVKDDFKVETQDPRFSALFESHEYALDPTNPRFKSTAGMKTLLEEGRKKRKLVGEDQHVVKDEAAKKIKKNTGDAELNGLVARLKDKRKKS